MTGFILEVDLPDGDAVCIDGDNVKYWAGFGLPTYEGGMEGFATLYPQVIEYLLKRRLIRAFLKG